MHQIPIHEQDHRMIIDDGHKTTQNHREFSGRDQSATGLTLGVTGVLDLVEE